MNYVKLTVAGFKERLEAADYNGLTGARRAIGKVAGWSEKDRNEARKLADAYFANAPKAAAKAPAAKKTFTGKGRPKKAAAKKVAAAKPAPKAVEAAAPKPAAKPPAPKKAAAKAATKPASAEAPRAIHHAPSAIQPAPAAFEEGARANAAATVIQVMRGTGPLTALEQRTYDVAQQEYWLSARATARHAVDVASNGVPVLPSTQPPPQEVVTAPTNIVPRIPIQTAPNGTAEGLTPEQQEQFERLKKGAPAIPAILGQGNPPGTQS